MDDTPKTEGNTTRKKGKMYWKFATLKGWQANKDSSPTADPETDETTKKEAGHSSDGPDQSGR